MLLSKFSQREYKKRDWQFWNNRKKSEPKNNTLRNVALGTAGTAALLYGGRVGVKAIPKIQRLKHHAKEYGVVNKLLREGGHTPEMREDYLDSLRGLIIRNKDNLDDLDYMTKKSMGINPKNMERDLIARKLMETAGEDFKPLLKNKHIKKYLKLKKPKNKDKFVRALLKKYPDVFKDGFNPSVHVPSPD